MSLAGSIRNAPDGVKGFDANAPISSRAAQQFIAAGHRFCVRYVGRVAMAPTDISAAEAQDILDSGLALMPVQHVEAGEWMPSGALGQQYGRNAATFSAAVGFPAGVNVWLDLESVSTSATAADVTAYCNAWYDEVAAGGFTPGIYVGWQPMLSDEELLESLKFDHYWGAYNVDAVIPQRGWQMKQSPSTEQIAGIDHDINITRIDGLGGQVLWLAPTAGDAAQLAAEFGTPALLG